VLKLVVVVLGLIASMVLVIVMSIMLV